MATLTRPGTTAAVPGRRWLLALEYWLVAYRRTWRGGVFSNFFAPLLFVGSIGYGLGSLVDAGALPGGVSYVHFVAPGVLAAAAMQTAVGDSTYAVLSAVKWTRQYYAMLASPLRVADVLLGHEVFLALRVLSASAVFLAVGALLGAWASPLVVLTLPVAVLCGLVHALPAQAIAVLAEDDRPFALIMRFGVTPMFLFAGTFFPIAGLPAWAEWLARVTPLWHATEVCRALSLGSVPLPSAAGHLAYLLALLALGYAWALRRYRRRLER